MPVKPTLTVLGDNAVLFQWTLTTATPDGEPIGPQWAEYRDRTVQFSGVFGGATVVWEGSNIPVTPTYGTLNDAQGSALSKLAAAGPKQVMEHTHWARPNNSGGDGTTAIVVSAVLVRNALVRSA